MKVFCLKTARLISNISAPLIISPLIIFLLSGVVATHIGQLKTFLIILLFNYIAPFSFLFWSIKKGTISDRDITNRKQRYSFYLVGIFSFLLAMLIFYLLSEQQLLLFLMKILLIFSLMTGINFFWKISGHTFANSLLVLLLFFRIYGPKLQSVNFSWPVFTFTSLSLILLVSVAWSRVVLKKHTIGQLVAGSLLPWLIVLL